MNSKKIIIEIVCLNSKCEHYFENMCLKETEKNKCFELDQNGQCAYFKEINSEDKEIKNVKKIMFDRIDYLVNLGKAIEKAYQAGFIMAEVEQVCDENKLTTNCKGAYGTIEGLLEEFNIAE